MCSILYSSAARCAARTKHLIVWHEHGRFNVTVHLGRQQCAHRTNAFITFTMTRGQISTPALVLVRYSIYRSIAILVNVLYQYLMVSRYFDISNDQTILGRYIVRSGVSSRSILKQPSIGKHCLKTSISRYLLLIVRLSILQTSILVSSIATSALSCHFEVSSYRKYRSLAKQLVVAISL